MDRKRKMQVSNTLPVCVCYMQGGNKLFITSSQLYLVVEIQLWQRRRQVTGTCPMFPHWGPDGLMERIVFWFNISSGYHLTVHKNCKIDINYIGQGCWTCSVSILCCLLLALLLANTGRQCFAYFVQQKNQKINYFTLASVEDSH